MVVRAMAIVGGVPRSRDQLSLRYVLAAHNLPNLVASDVGTVGVELAMAVEIRLQLDYSHFSHYKT